MKQILKGVKDKEWKGKGSLNMPKAFWWNMSRILILPFLIVFPFPWMMKKDHVSVLSHWTGSSPCHPSWDCTIIPLPYALTSQGNFSFPPFWFICCSELSTNHIFEMDFSTAIRNFNLLRHILRHSRQSTKLQSGRKTGVKVLHSTEWLLQLEDNPTEGLGWGWTS